MSFDIFAMPETTQSLPVVLLAAALLALAAMLLLPLPRQASAPLDDSNATPVVKETPILGATSPSESIVVSSPRFGEEVSESFLLEGQARQSVGREISVRLKASESNALLFSGTVITDPEREKELAHFSREVPLPEGLINNLSLTLEVAPMSRGQREADVRDTILIPFTYTRRVKEDGLK